MTSGPGLSLRSSRGSAVADADGVATRLSLLGMFEIHAGARPVQLPHHVQRLLAFLALQGRPLHRAYVAGRLWIDHSQEHAHGCLRSTLWRLGRSPGPLIDVTTTHLALSAGVVVDVRELQDCTERLLHGEPTPTREDLDLLIQAAELLPDWYDDWILDERERLRQLRLLALEAACTELIARRRHAEAVEAALAAVYADPLRESAQRLLISSHAGDGNVAEALRQYEAFRGRLHGKLGLEPSPRMTELVEGLRAGL